MEISVIKAVIDTMPQEFDSHDFIRKLIWEAPQTYGELLVKHENVTTAHAEISKYLLNYSGELGIEKATIDNEKLKERMSADIFGNIVPCAMWNKK